MNSRRIAIATMIGLLFVEVAGMSFALGQPEDRTTDEDVALIESELEELKEMPEMKIAAWAIHRDEKEVVIWVYGLTPENQQLDDKIIGGWRLIVAQSPVPADQNESREIAKDYLLNSSTFRFDGIEDGVMLVETNTLKCPYCWEFVFEFQCRHAGYGNRTGQILAQVITPHTARIIVEQGRVTSAIMDGKWNMLEQRMIEDFYTYSSPDATPSVQWSKTFGGAGLDCAKSAQQISDGGYVLAGYTRPYEADYEDAWLVKTDCKW